MIWIKAWAFARRDFRTELQSRAPFLFHLLNILIGVASYVFLARLISTDTLAQVAPGEEGYFGYVLVGMAANAMMVASLTGLTRSLQYQQPSGVLKPLLFGHTPLGSVLLCSSVYPALRALADLILYMAIGWYFSGLALERMNTGAAALLSLLAVAAFGSLGVVSAALAILYRLGNPFMWVMGSLAWLLSGVLFPPEVLPRPLLLIARCIPLTHVLDGMRMALHGAPLGSLRVPVAYLLAFTGICLPLGLLIFRHGLDRARSLGTLSEW